MTKDLTVTKSDIDRFLHELRLRVGGAWEDKKSPTLMDGMSAWEIFTLDWGEGAVVSLDQYSDGPYCEYNSRVAKIFAKKVAKIKRGQRRWKCKYPPSAALHEGYN